jgi:hypothetical protein
VTGVRFMVNLRWQELIRVQEWDGCNARELVVDAWGGGEALQGPIIARGGGATEVARRRGVVAAVT